MFAICESVFKLSNLWRRLAVVGLCATLSLHAVSLSAQDEAGWESELTGQRLRVCIWPDYRGVSFRDPRSGVLSGIDIDMAYALAADIGRTVEFVDSSFAKLIDDPSQSRCDVAMFAVGVTPNGSSGSTSVPPIWPATSSPSPCEAKPACVAGRISTSRSPSWLWRAGPGTRHGCHAS